MRGEVAYEKQNKNNDGTPGETQQFTGVYEKVLLVVSFRVADDSMVYRVPLYPDGRSDNCV